ncbi:MAG TPA: hypothetical protein IAA39_02510 [Candidatus Olsenella avistercoris]|nr:hypothetical protein [Candidatus Olsenella avistercoris]
MTAWRSAPARSAAQPRSARCPPSATTSRTACARCGEKDPDYVALAETDEPQKPEPESDELPDAGDASLPAMIMAGAGSLLCLVAAPRLRRR